MSKEKHVLAVESRTETGKGPAGRLRRLGKIPAIVYSKGAESTPLTLDSKEWRTLMKHDVNLVDLEGNGKVIKALIKHVEEDFLKGEIVHVDFVEVKMDQAITTSVAIHALPGSTAAGVVKGGDLEQVMHELQVTCLPGNLPELIEVDLVELDMDEAMHVEDLKLPEGVSAEDAPDSVVFRITQAKAEEEEVAATDEGEEKAEEGEKGKE